VSWAAQAVIAALIFAAGGAGGIKWQLGVQARAELAAADLRARDAARQIKVIDQAATAHVTALAKINQKLGDAREKIALLSGRECFDAGTAGVLNAIGDQPVRTPPGESAGEAPATAPGGDIRYSTDRDAAGAIAICRARYAEVSSQINQILDIEEARSAGKK
jgi:hypothetical protein